MKSETGSQGSLEQPNMLNIYSTKNLTTSTNLSPNSRIEEANRLIKEVKKTLKMREPKHKSSIRRLDLNKQFDKAFPNR